MQLARTGVDGYEAVFVPLRASKMGNILFVTILKPIKGRRTSEIAIFFMGLFIFVFTLYSFCKLKAIETAI